MPETEIARYSSSALYLPPLARKRLKRLTKNTVVDRRRIDSDLQRVRKQGYAANDEEFIRCIAAIAVPIFDGQY